jgi:galactofuranosylgalactofuranosylrhamnosyl-N-acetylglucosaminyl-diphospho-decaprenol beta-1,5/1,6-galactofuranosyltransferase
MRRSFAVHQRLALEWEELAERYRGAIPELTGPEAWVKTWGDSDGQ